MSGEPEVVNLMWGGMDQAPKPVPDDLAFLFNKEENPADIDLRLPDGTSRVIPAEENLCACGCGEPLDDEDVFKVEAVELPFLAVGSLALIETGEDPDDEVGQYLETLPNEIEVGGMTFKKITTELYRGYGYIENGELVYLVFNDPLYVNISPSGSHRLITMDGCSHWIAPGFKTITWTPRGDNDNFVF